GKYEEAEEMSWRALEGYVNALGKEQPYMLTSVYKLAFLFHQQEQFEAASALHERASSKYERGLDLEHPTPIVCSRHYSSQMRVIQGL
ncbi:hypothetical protein K469DRAFT_604379, partial [Zopfia rhizophila CBS 207.26]